ncbi:MAG TPA: S8 family serine peptidase [Candidatus Acidoferrales bacterium]|nr:S8 family serine peptidase [Candidatus Acidoferrales bacterium]
MKESSLSSSIVRMKLRVLIRILFWIAVVAGVCAGRSPAQSKYWIFFRDKPNAEPFTHLGNGKSSLDYLVESGLLSQRAISRRLKVLPVSSVVSISDFPVYPPYLDSLESIGLAIDGTSRWFNAAIVIGDSARLAAAEKFSFVVGIKKIVACINPIKPIGGIPVSNTRLNKTLMQSQPGDSSFYGPSYTQLELSGIPQVHALGINGSGVLIGMLDVGFRYESHDALKNIKIVGEHDFIQNDSITENQAGDSPDQDEHGTLTLSAIGGYSPGNLVGAAYGASFMLAKTELIYPDPGDIDYKSEEDNWVRGIEWMEARGVDIVSSSVAYNVFVDSLTGAIDSSESYFWSRGDFNGRTALASIAATRAAELGVVVVQAMGNEGNGNGVAGTMDVPADADSIISVGAVDWDGILATFSSTGPTNDNRIKPDLVADGSSDYAASVPGPDTYEYVSGTSLSTPITAGAAALILSVRPDFAPMQVINLLKSTAVYVEDPSFPARTSTYPNNFYGSGIVNVWNAIRKLGLVGSNTFTFWQRDSSFYFAARAYGTHGIDISRSRVYYSTDGAHYSTTAVSQTDTVNEYAFKIPVQGSPSVNFFFYFLFADSNGDEINVPYYGSADPFSAPGWMLYLQQSQGNFVLFNNYPNPFNSQTRISLALKSAADVKIDIYDILGRKIRNFFRSNASGYQEFIWNGREDNGMDVSSGVYLIEVNVGGTIRVLKALYLK